MTPAPSPSPVTTFTLTYLAGTGGSITGATPQTLDYGQDGTAVTATPATGYHFVDWSDGLTGGPAPATMEDGLTATAPTRT